MLISFPSQARAKPSESMRMKPARQTISTSAARKARIQFGVEGFAGFAFVGDHLGGNVSIAARSSPPAPSRLEITSAIL